MGRWVWCNRLVLGGVAGEGLGRGVVYCKGLLLW